MNAHHQLRATGARDGAQRLTTAKRGNWDKLTGFRAYDYHE